MEVTNSSSETDYLHLSLAEMEAINDRFNNRVNAGQLANPPTKAFARKAIHRHGTGRCPARMKRLTVDVVLRYGDALADLFCEFPDDVVPILPYDVSTGYQASDRVDRINTLEILTTAAEWSDEWGARWRHAFGGVGSTTVSYPLADWAQLDEYLATKMPNPRAPGRLDAAVNVLQLHGATKYCYAFHAGTLFERFHMLRGMENVFTDLYVNPSESHKLLDALCNHTLEMARYWCEIGVDGIMFADDWGTQTSLMISPAMWRETFKPYYKIIFDEVHRLGKDVMFHSCGHVLPIVGDLIDVGVDVLDPLQPKAMDLAQLAREYGGKISFSGGIDVQDLLAFGKPQEIKDEICRLIDTVSRPYGDGLIIGPSCGMTP
jgi:uroporphyrinogen decarboxylase